MRNWLELEKRFEELAPTLDSARLDSQTGGAGEHWHLAASFDNIAKARFEVLAQIAGRKLRQQFTSDQLPEDVLNASDDKIVWYRYMATARRFYESSGGYAYPVDDKGERCGDLIFSGTIRNPAAVSATLCLDLAAKTNEAPAKEPIMSINSSGNSRVYVGRNVDNSQNTYNNNIVFSQIREALSAVENPAEREQLCKHLDALEASVNQPTFVQRYKEFIELAANHMQVLWPFIPALTSLLG